MSLTYFNITHIIIIELQVESDKAKQGLVSLLHQDIKGTPFPFIFFLHWANICEGTITAIFNQCLSENDDLRLKAIAFIFEKVDLVSPRKGPCNLTCIFIKVFPMRDEINKDEDVQRCVGDNIKKVGNSKG